MIRKEFCAENFTLIPKAIKAGANRIELCDNLSVGGTTVSLGVLEETLHYCHEKQIPVMSLIRPRGGDFIYNDIEVKIMQTDLLEAKKMGTDGVVIGCLDESNWIDEEALALLVESSEGLQITFHMAFDKIPRSKQFLAIDYLIEQGVDRILTHGGLPETPIEENLTHLKELIQYAHQRIMILPGGGVTSENCQSIADRLNIQEVHGTKIVSLT